MPATPCPAFILTRHARDTPQGLTLRYWAASSEGPLLLEFTGQEGVFFVPRDSPAPADRRGAVALSSLSGDPVDALYFRSTRRLQETRKALSQAGAPAFESDIRPADRYLMERFITGPVLVHGEGSERRGYRAYLNPTLVGASHSPTLRSASIDIETEGLDGALYSIAGRCGAAGVVFVVGEGADSESVRFLRDERSVLSAFFDWVRAVDPDLLIGWNVIAFDLIFLANRCRQLKIPFALGRDGEIGRVYPGERVRQPARADIPGRMVIDGIPALRTAGYGFEDFSLESVGRELLGRGKLIAPGEDRVAEINRLYREDKAQLAAYNLEDCDLVQDIFEQTALVPFLVARATLTGLTMDRMPGSIAAFEFLYLPRLHRRGFVAPDVQERPEANPNPGGYVLDSSPGLYDNVLVFDFKSLYPSIIRTVHIDPLAMHQPVETPIPGFQGGTFSREATILGGLIETLWAAREQAKREKDQSLNLATKILMNAFYGVLGTPTCRFYSPKLASSITRRSHEILTRTRGQIEAAGHPVIYGDTDSLFVALGPGYREEEALEIGRALAPAINTWWAETLRAEFGIESFLELQFETCYLKFLMPTIRGSLKGTKKRYAGLRREADGSLGVTFRGLESVRTDWTPLARQFQRELYRRVFVGEPFEGYVFETARDLLAGKLDDLLVYRKRLRKDMEDYTKNVPPQVQAARKLAHFRGSVIHYVITLHGPEPVQQRRSPIDYGHYLNNQLAPVADAILAFCGTSFGKITDPQLWLFE
ncbi:MAG: DNA polymerase II [Candidatus Hydrogenedentes bacterium]|nr:DNA polymerase II [Candidatus Hydrogenedentota bacterium]